MKICKDCIHYDVCFIVKQDGDGRVLKNSPCKHFKDNFLVLDLPCNVGDTVYYAGIDTPVRFFVIGFSQGRMYLENLEDYSELLDEGDIVEGEWYVHLDTMYGLSQMSPISEFGRTIFIGENAEKEAEQALKGGAE